MKEVLLYCTDGHAQTAIAKYSQKKWTILGISETHEGFEYEKVLFDTTFDEIIAFNSTSGVSYLAVKKADLWGLIRFRQDPGTASYKENYRKALGNEPIDMKAKDALGREIKLIEGIKYPDINIFKDKYHLDDFNRLYSSIEDNTLREIPGIIPEWSDTIIEITKDALSNFTFVCGSKGTVRMKRIDSSLGFITISDATSKKYNVHHDDDEGVDYYNNVFEMIEDGWVLD